MVGDSLVGEHLTQAPPPYERVALPLRAVVRLERGFRPSNGDVLAEAVRRETVTAAVAGVVGIAVTEVVRHGTQP